MTRLDRYGCDVTDLPGLWSADDCEIVATNFNHPTITAGMHTNGPATWWIRRAESGEWVRTGVKHKHLIREIWVSCGEECFEPWEGTET